MGTEISYSALKSLGCNAGSGVQQLDGRVHCDAIAAFSACLAASSKRSIKFFDPISVGHIREIGSRTGLDAGAEFALRPSLRITLDAYEQVHFFCRIGGNHWVLALFEAVDDDAADGYRLSVMDSNIDSSEDGNYVSKEKESLVGDLR
jgi:hypothetical protein